MFSFMLFLTGPRRVRVANVPTLGYLEVICIFAESRITRNGKNYEFYQGSKVSKGKECVQIVGRLD